MRILFLTLLILIFFTAISAARADTATDIIRVQCMPELNILTIEKETLFNDFPLYALYKNAPLLKEKYGIVIMSYYEEYLKILSKDPGREFFQGSKAPDEALVILGPNNEIKKLNKNIFTCTLQTGDNPLEKKLVTYTIELQGIRSCWDSNNGASITIKDSQNVPMLDKIPFSVSCEDPDNPDKEKTITEITWYPKDYYSFFRITGDNVFKDLWLHKKKTYTYEDIYK